MKNNTFRAPQATLKTSWVQIAYSKPKSLGPTIKRSLGNRPNAIVKDRGNFISSTSNNNSNIY